MKAIVQHGYGLPQDVLRLQDVAIPVAGAGQVLLRTGAAGVAIGDWLTVRGQPYIARPAYGLRRPKNTVAGQEAAGQVERVGSGVAQLHSGDDLFGWCNGTLAEYVVVSPHSLAPKPANLTPEQAAAVPISGCTALQALRDAGRLQRGQDVLIVGASGAVGTFAVQIAKALGATVTGVCSTRNVELVRSIGADHVIDYVLDDIAAGEHRYDLILDLAGNRPLSTLRAVLAPKGTLVIVGGSGGSWFMGFGRTIRAAVLSPLVSQQLRPFFSQQRRDDLLALKELIESGELTPVIDRTYPLSDAVDALRHVGDRHTRGKTIVTT
ncbi:NAD(P)-dependent alcohol dehydrogenase [Jiangella mangrovi]|uniref:NADPH:quinone reductase-like Zn-dependent oxidoreductase n=1 Tax=Jiangella mangrovi TaxID=1524084 RepID=A0A7W9LNK5_9ACTN|nr:NAD(P)-dependent alcohol dehydrogenase [Jiangella mangrovi]MBB5790376.1 NADPH:quinone reductase-like Zn-dependent oxidoreductase [Jiangella mangrovi]